MRLSGQEGPLCRSPKRRTRISRLHARPSLSKLVPPFVSITERRTDTVPAEFSGPPREEVPVPDVPPFTSFVGNLTFETDEDQLRQFFSAQSPSSVRLVKDPTGKPKGFGYVEFPSKKDLVDALTMNMTNMGGRTIRVSVAEARKSISFVTRRLRVPCLFIISIKPTRICPIRRRGS